MATDLEQQTNIPVLVTDFDGTMTRYDFFRLAQARLVPPGTPDYWDEYLAGRMTHFAALQRIFAAIVADTSDMMEAARAMELDPRLHEAVERLQGHGWHIVIASAGCLWYIDRLLAEREVQVTVHANPGAFDPDHGLLIGLPEESPYFSPQTGISKEAVVRAMVETHRTVAFAGDGRPDLPAALLVPPERRFACGWLAEQFRADGTPFRAFNQWSEIADMLLGSK